MTAPADLVLYGDFNCPFSAVASARAARLERDGLATVDWRAVEHAPEVPAGGNPVEGDLREMFDDEVARIGELLTDADDLTPRRPPVQPNTRAATAAYAGLAPEARPAFRDAVFRALWEEGRDIGDPSVLADLGAPPEGDDATAATWRAEWEALPTIVPVLVLPDGYVSKGLGALARLAAMAEEAAA